MPVQHLQKSDINCFAVLIQLASNSGLFLGWMAMGQPRAVWKGDPDMLPACKYDSKSIILVHKQWTSWGLFGSPAQRWAACQDIPFSREVSRLFLKSERLLAATDPWEVINSMLNFEILAKGCKDSIVHSFFRPEPLTKSRTSSGSSYSQNPIREGVKNTKGSFLKLVVQWDSLSNSFV